MKKINWIKLDVSKDIGRLIIMGSVYPREAYFALKNNYDLITLQILSYDLERKNFSVLKLQFDKLAILYNERPEGFYIDSDQIDEVFCKSDFGWSLDKYKLTLSNKDEISWI